MPASGTVTLQRRARHYFDPDDWPQDDSATQEAPEAPQGAPQGSKGAWWGDALEE